jgi:Uma2 family endonuclease
MGAMSEAPLRETWTWEAYLEWEAGQPERYELVDGRVYARGGGTAGHDIICNNLRYELWMALRGQPLRLHGPKLKVRAGQSVRYPDALIDCGAWVPEAVVAGEPVAVFDVLPRSTDWIDQHLKLRDYDATACIRYYGLINQNEPQALVYIRDGSGHFRPGGFQLLEGVAASIDLPEYGVSLPFAAIYDGLA